MSDTLKAVLSTPPLKRITPGSAQAIASVEALAEQQANAPQKAADFTKPQPETKGLSFSLSLNPSDGKIGITSAHAIFADVEKLNGQFNFSFRF